MNQAELVARIAEATGLSRRRARAILDAGLAEIRASLARGERVTLSGFGTFDVRQARETTRRLPRTGEIIQVPSRRVVVFRSGRELQGTVERRLDLGVADDGNPSAAGRSPPGGA
jgi:DNA-binding protein HU-beta